MKAISKYGTLVIVVIALIVFGPIMLNIVYSWKSSIGFIDSTNYQGWIGFAGSIIGGSMTLVGVALTIDRQRKAKIDELSIQFKPILNIKRKEEDSSLVDTTNKNITILLNLENIGRGEADLTSINVDEFHLFSDDQQQIEVSRKASDMHIESPNLWTIPSNDYITLFCETSFSDINLHQIFRINLTLTITYTGLYGKTYTANIKCSIDPHFSMKTYSLFVSQYKIN